MSDGVDRRKCHLRARQEKSDSRQNAVTFGWNGHRLSRARLDTIDAREHRDASSSSPHSEKKSSKVPPERSVCMKRSTSLVLHSPHRTMHPIPGHRRSPRSLGPAPAGRCIDLIETEPLQQECSNRVSCTWLCDNAFNLRAPSFARHQTHRITPRPSAPRQALNPRTDSSAEKPARMRRALPSPST